MYQSNDWPAAPLSRDVLNQVHCIDALELLQQLPDESINCIVTSPPYYGLRNYNVEGQIGLEQTPAAYVARLAAVFREARRVLRADGTLWVNIGDSYVGGGKYAPNAPSNQNGGSLSSKGAGEGGARTTSHIRVVNGFPEKSLIGIPWRVAFALQDDGWILRQDNIWHKPAPMPESVRDRTTRAHEYVFHFAKSPRYWYDAESIKEGNNVYTRKGTKGGHKLIKGGAHFSNPSGTAAGFSRDITTVGRNKRSVWTIGPEPFAGEHYAAYPSRLPEICILAGCPPGGVVYDPFMGSGTTALVARRLGRHFIGSDLSPEYVAMARKRLAQPFTLPMFAA